jgi:transaldolase
LDYIHRDLFSSGQLRALIAHDSLTGITSNPAIFEKAIVDSSAYDEQIMALSSVGQNASAIYEALSLRDVQQAADELRVVFDATDGQDGYVSLEVNPHLAHDSAGTLVEARRLWAALGRPNVFIKVPGTPAGLAAIRELIGEGISINVTLLFSVPRYLEVIEAYLSGLEARAAKGLPIKSVASVASFFISRIDALVDPLLDARGSEAQGLRGEVAIASAKVAYHKHLQIFSQQRFAALKARGAQVQRLLWASTSTKDKRYSDLKYVESLIGANTINTMPLETLLAYRDHGQPKPRLTEQIEHAEAVLAQLGTLGVDLQKVTAQLEAEGVTKFIQPFDQLLDAVQSKQASARSPRAARQ